MGLCEHEPSPWETNSSLKMDFVASVMDIHNNDKDCYCTPQDDFCHQEVTKAAHSGTRYE
jgi:hypothetical protein